MKIYLVRHGETQWNTEKRLQGWKDSPLTENGVHYARLLGNRLKGMKFASVYSSPSERALHTAKLITSDEVKIIEELREISFGKWEGRTQEEIEKDFLQEYRNFWFHPHQYNHIHHDGEGLLEFKERAKKAMTSILEFHQTGNLLIVTHGAMIKALISYFWNIPLEQFWDPPFIEGASLSIIKWDGKVFHQELLGDTAHMDPYRYDFE